MKNNHSTPKASANEYYGRILSGSYSDSLKSHVAQCITHYRNFDATDNLAIPYISAWQDVRKDIWYEFVSRKLIALLRCDYSNAGEILRNNIIERHVYSNKNSTEGIRQNIITRKAMNRRSRRLRQEAENNGTIEAVYKITVNANETFWLKDQAVIRSFDADHITISLGCLTVVTKEMQAEEQLKRTQKALRKSERKFRDLSIHDNLTGLFNTRYLYKALSRLISQRSITNESFSLIFMDIDNFKHVVDTYGHLSASQTLQEIAVTIKNTLPQPAFGVAYGGDEFVIVLPGFDKRQAVEMAEKIRLRIKESSYLSDAGLSVRVSASLGVSTCPHDADTVSHLLALADQAMFSVKERGKDSVCGISYATTLPGQLGKNIVSSDCY